MESKIKKTIWGLGRLLAVSLTASLIVSGCGGDDASVAVDAQNKYQDELKKWAENIQITFDDANASIDHLKAVISNAGRKDNAELMASLIAAQSAIQEVSQKQKEAINQLEMATTLLGKIADENVRLAAEKKLLEQRAADLQSRERLFSMGFYTSLGAAMLALFGLFTKFPTMFLDRELLKLGIEAKRIEVEGMRVKNDDLEAGR